MTATELLRDIRARLTPSSGDLAQNDAEYIIEQSLNISKTRLYTDASVIIDDDGLARVNAITERHLRGEPLPYIFGKAYFYDREFFVNGDVLIPRPDTETLIETIINTEKDRPARFVDIGTGSGILAAVLTAHRPAWSAVAVDISYRALRTAARNTNKSVCLVCCDMMTAVKPHKRFDFVVSNPPYISSAQMEKLDGSVVNYEPHTALHGGDDGLYYYRMISDTAGMYLKDSGRVYLEIGYDQGESVPGIFRDGGWSDITVIKDLGGRDRVVTAVWRVS
jgi:release factor glutamine methyltransferase